jgi:hypothetical protein
MVHQVKCDFTSGLFKTTNAQMPKGSPNRQQHWQGNIAATEATVAIA